LAGRGGPQGATHPRQWDRHQPAGPNRRSAELCADQIPQAIGSTV